MAFRDRYREYLLTHIKPWAKPASGGKVINCRCPYCPDSKNPNKGHFYISIPVNDEEPSLYYCQKCNAKGVVTNRKLIEWNIPFDSNMSAELVRHNASAISSTKYRYIETGIYNIKYLTVMRQDELTQFKLQYIKDRIGLHLSYNDCVALKIVLNISDLFKQNPSLEATRDQRIMQQLEDNFLGFLSHDNAFLNMRNLGIGKVYETIDRRYINYKVIDKYDNTLRFYNIPIEIDLRDSHPIEIHIAEGPFDILSIFNLRQRRHRVIYASVDGSGYKGLIAYLISFAGFPSIVLHIYPDNDIDDWTIQSQMEYFGPFIKAGYIHRNSYPGEKDFGVPIGKIQETVRRVI